MKHIYRIALVALAMAACGSKETKPGTVVTVPAGTKHWHGAARDGWMLHLAYYTDHKATYRTEWLEPVTDETYNKIR